ncbi:MAG: hypothetical protein IJE79_01525 [Alphaproteobacteria bacterium]|nr:hypothetical protein [Alphaproteobacteria bacterium]
MEKTKLKKLLWGGIMTGMLMGAPSCSTRDSESDDSEDDRTELVLTGTDKSSVEKYNTELFESLRSKIKFGLAFVENYYPYIYKDGGGTLTTGHGLTILYEPNGTYKKVTKDTPVPSLSESDRYKGRYMTIEILKDIQKYVKVPMDENTMLTTCVFRYCIGGKSFKESEYLKQLNKGKTGAELTPYLTGFRQQKGVLKRLYFFAALMEGEIEFSDLLDLRTEGCYNIESWEGLVSNVDKNFYSWNFQNIDNYLEIAKKERIVSTRVWDANAEKFVKIRHECKLVKDIVPEYIYNEVSGKKLKKTKRKTEDETKRYNAKQAIETRNEENSKNADTQNDISYIAYQNCDYKTALNAGKKALKYSVSSKQYGAAHYNIGVAYSAMGKPRKAINNLNLSISFNETDAAKDALKVATHKYKIKRNTAIVYSASALVLSAGIVALARRKRMLQKRQR